MEEKELNKIIEKIENENPKAKAFFGIQRMDNDDEAYIKANKFGLELFACELLKASAKADAVLKDSEKNIIVLDSKLEWITGDIWLGYIEPKEEDRIDLVDKKSSSKITWKDIITIGVLIILALITILTFAVGAITIYDWVK